MKTLKFLFVALALLMVAPTFTSCKDDEKDEPGAPQSSASLVGTWVWSGNSDTERETWIFSSNGTFISTYTYYYNGEWETYSDNGTYTFDGSTIILRFSYGEVSPYKIIISGNSFVDEYGDVYYKR